MRRIAGVAAAILTVAGSPALASDVCARVSAFEAAPFADGSSSRTVLFRWLVDEDGPVVTCNWADAPSGDLCHALTTHLSREFGHPLAIQLLECHGYRVPGAVLDRDNLPLIAQFVLDSGRLVRIETSMKAGGDTIRLTASTAAQPGD